MTPKSVLTMKPQSIYLVSLLLNKEKQKKYHFISKMKASVDNFKVKTNYHTE